jgi:competence protein ComEA
MQGIKKVYYAIFIAIILICGIIYTNLQENEHQKEVFVNQNNQTPIPTVVDTLQEKFIYIQLCGAIENEGVYKVVEGTRVFEAVEKAGGLSPDAAIEAVNQARALKDGEQIYFPTRSEIVTGAYQKEAAPSLVNINTASKDELMTLPGIGEARAISIIQYRETNNGFQCIEDIMKISGIKESMFEKIKALITV